jgi:hypothetical protein
MECKYCNGKCQKAGKQKNGAQKLYCRTCRKYQQPVYKYCAYSKSVGPMIARLVCESVSVRGIGRIPEIAGNTFIHQIKCIARAIIRPEIVLNRNCVEMDERAN